ncbi:MAG: cyclic lactone autoinducer peptide [Eubacteriales bacterium]
MKKFISKYGSCITAFALIISTYSANVTCGLFFNQPKLPDSVKKLRKF